MFKNKKTVFILGAGASNPYSYPLGKELIEEIKKNIENDFVNLPIDVVYAKNPYNHDLYNFMDFEKYLLNMDVNNLNSFSKLDIPSGNYGPGSSVKLNHIKELSNLKKILHEFDPTSIDAFLYNNPAYSETGKIMIIYSLLKHEDKNRFCSSSKNNDNDNWYSYLLNDIYSGCKEPKDIFKNELSIVTFNYDLSLEYYLFDRISRTEFFKKDDIAKKYIEKLKENCIFHVYGKLYSDEVEKTYGNFFIDTDNTDKHILNTRRFVKAMQSREEIHLIKEQRETISNISENIKKIINDAEQIIIIGFGFDRDNLTQIGFPETLPEYKKFFEGKIIKYMDYKGKMNPLFKNFSDIQQFLGKSHTKEYKPNLIRSIDSSISTAYQNDFKLSLFK